MKIAFVSCICTSQFPDQPIWRQIAKHAPDHLVLLGDSVYLDIDTHPLPHPQQMDVDSFGQHLFTRYTELLAQPDFVQLVQNMPLGHVHSIWDDHDFLWNDAHGANVSADPTQSDKVRLSTAFHEVFRDALADGLRPGSFPASYSDDRFWNSTQPPLETPSKQLAHDLWLHLCDVRSFRTGTFLVPEAERTLLGDAQRRRIAAAITSVPNAVHILASGSTVAGWERYKRDREWLMSLAAGQRMILLSGDIHRNAVDGFYTGGFSLHELTSSGAAVRDGVVIGNEQQNFGLLDVQTGSVEVKHFHFGRQEALLARTYDRDRWLPA